MMIIMELILLENTRLETNILKKIGIKIIRKGKVKAILTLKLAMLQKVSETMVLLNIQLAIKIKKINKSIMNIIININHQDSK
jgi:hypothetical protein